MLTFRPSKSKKLARLCRHYFSPVYLPMAQNQTARAVCSNSIHTADLARIWQWNEKLPPAVETCVHHLIRDKARLRPGAEAVCSRDGSLTYEELDAHASWLARRLIRHGVGLESLVPLCFEKSMWAVVAMLAVLKAGAAFVPVPCSPVQRIKNILAQINASAILTSPKQAIIFDGWDEHVIIVGSDASGEEEERGGKGLEVDVGPNNLAYVIFTSGSSGVPKVC